jgi:hypothetical protein
MAYAIVESRRTRGAIWLLDFCGRGLIPDDVAFVRLPRIDRVALRGQCSDDGRRHCYCTPSLIHNSHHVHSSFIDKVFQAGPQSIKSLVVFR